MKTSLSEHQAIIAMLFAGVVGALARWLSCGDDMTFSQFAGRSILNGMSGIAAFSLLLFYPEADNMAILGVGVLIIALGPTSLELLFQKVVKK